MSDGFLFEIHREPLAPPAPVARARTSDPQSSHAAAEQVESSGKAKKHRDRILDLVYEHPGCTTKELVRYLHREDLEDGLDRVELGRRMPELEQAGEIHRTKEGRSELRCYPGRAKE